MRWLPIGDGCRLGSLSEARLVGGAAVQVAENARIIAEGEIGDGARIGSGTRGEPEDDAAHFPATVNLTVRYDVRQLIDHFAESLGDDGAATPLEQLAPGNPERRRAAERLNIVDIETGRDETPAGERRFGAALAEALEKLAADDGNGADACRLTARAAREALKSTANARESTRTSAEPAPEG